MNVGDLIKELLKYQADTEIYMDDTEIQNEYSVLDIESIETNNEGVLYIKPMY